MVTCTDMLVYVYYQCEPSIVKYSVSKPMVVNNYVFHHVITIFDKCRH